jgi:hypothetical protein
MTVESVSRATTPRLVRATLSSSHHPSTGENIMDKSKLLAAAGIGYPLLLVLGFAAFPKEPGGDVSAGSHPAWLLHHESAVIVQSYVRSLGALAFIIFAVAVADAIRQRVSTRSQLPTLALVGGTLTGLLLLLPQALAIATVVDARNGGAGTTLKALASIQEGALTISSLPAIVLFAAAGIAMLKTSLTRPWLAYLTLAGVPLALLDSLTYDTGPFEPIGLVGLVYFLIWTLATALSLLANTNPHTNTTREPATA